MWTTARPVRAGGRAGTVVSLEHTIAEKRARLQREREESHELLARSDEMLARAEEMNCRFQVRAKKDMIRLAAELNEEARICQSGVREVDFDILASRYLRQYHREPRILESSGSKIITAPGAETSQTVETFTHANGLKEAQRSAVYNEYMAEVENTATVIATRARDACPFCDVDMLLNPIKSILVCPECGYCATYIDSTTAGMSYSDEYELFTFSYKRITHFDDCMKQVQGKESYVVPSEVIEKVMQELHAQRVVDVASITQMKIRSILKGMRERKAYDHVAQIYARITGRRAPHISSQMEERCRMMFVAMQPCFDKHCPKNRKNFLSYNYVLYRCFHLLGLTYMLGGFSLLKGKDKLALADTIFSNICTDLGWKFVPIEETSP